MPSYKEFCLQFGLKENPFASFTTENEGEKFSETFVKPNEYETILENFSQKNSIILSGDRGTGKTALIKDFTGKVSDKNCVVSQIIDYTQLHQNYELGDFYKFVLVNLSASLFLNLADKKKRINKLSREEKLLLCYLLKNFVPQISKTNLRDHIKKLQVHWFVRFYKAAENLVRGVFNYGATAANTLIDDYIAKHFTGLPPLSDSVKIKDYFPELPLKIEVDFIDQETSYSLIKRVISLAKNLNYNRILLVFDRVDEDSRFMNDAELISDFIVTVLTDNKFLLEPDLQVVFSTWSTPFNYIKDQVRTQKHYCPVLSWTTSDLEKALNKRLSVYSEGTVNDYKTLFSDNVNEDEIQGVFAIANGNPRDLWHIFNALFNAQYELDATSSKISKGAIPKAITQFVTTFNYYEYYPRKSTARANTMDIYSYAKHLLTLESEIFTKNQLNEKAQTGSSTNNYVVGMEKIGLVGVDSQGGGVVFYKIRDQKIIYALKNKLDIKRE